MSLKKILDPLNIGINANTAKNDAAKAAANAAEAAKFRPSSINNGPFGSSIGTRNPDGSLSYTNDPGIYGQQIPQLSGLAQYGNQMTGRMASAGPEGTVASYDPNTWSSFLNAQGAGNNYQGAANQAGGIFGNMASLAGTQAAGDISGQSALGQGSNNLLGSASNFLSNTDPSQIYQQLTALAQPGETSATQNMFNNLQSTGRLGLTQNGELGDMGGLSLAQMTADNQRRLQAMQFGQSQAQAGGNLGLGMAQQGNANTGVFSQLMQQMLQAKQGGAAAANQNYANAGNLAGLGQDQLTQAMQLGNYGLGSLGTIQGALGNNFNQGISASTGNQVGAAQGAGYGVNAVQQANNNDAALTAGLAKAGGTAAVAF